LFATIVSDVPLVKVVPAEGRLLPPSDQAGRFCPADYRLPANAFSVANSAGDCDVLYVVGGLYGNTAALRVILQAFDAEPAHNKRLVFNGDFHWFDVDENQFSEIEMLTTQHLRLRGNVETELARAQSKSESDIDPGCGCAYPADVADSIVDYSNRMTLQLRRTYQFVKTRSGQAGLETLPMTVRLEVAGVGVGITHGDDQSLAGWRFAQNNIARTFAEGLSDVMQSSDIHVLASSHTCLPVLYSQSNRAVINNGAAGMSNFWNTTHGLITRIANGNLSADSCPLPISYESKMQIKGQPLRLQALEVSFNDESWQSMFTSQWPPGSPGYLSYWNRIRRGPNYSLEEAMQYER
jgi:hypothetical protein